MDIDATRDALAKAGRLTAGFTRPDDAVRDFLDDLEEFCRSIVDEMPPNSDLAQTFSPPAQLTLVEIQRIRDEESH